MVKTLAADVVERIQCANVIYPIVKRLIQHVAINSSPILGAAVVHEIGHFYLGTDVQAHSLTGVMRGFWSYREIELAGIGELRFTASKARVFAPR